MTEDLKRLYRFMLARKGVIDSIQQVGKNYKIHGTYEYEFITSSSNNSWIIPFNIELIPNG